MEISIKNIGIIGNATVRLDGLTLIAGLNGTGKSTIGKTLYALIAAVENLQEVNFKDKVRFAYRELTDCIGNFLPFSFSVRPNEDSGISNPVLDFFSRAQQSYPDLESLIASVESLRNYLEQMTKSEYEELIKLLQRYRPYREYSAKFQENKDETLKVFDAVLNSLRADPDLQNYANKRIEKTLDTVFNHQIPPQKLKTESFQSSIKVSDEKTKYFDIILENGKISGKKPAYLSKWLDSAILIDDPYSVDKMTEYKLQREFSVRFHRRGDPRVEISVESPENALCRKLRTESDSLFESMVREEQSAEILNLISGVFSEEIVLSDGEYVVGQEKLNVKNLATGVKLFAILKSLITKGFIRKNTLLVLDEPEAHLHPEWQNRLAEIIALLVNKAGVKVVLTTHSAHFMIAIDAMMRKYHIEEVTHFYFNSQKENTFEADVKCVDDELEKIYTKFLSPYEEMFELKEELLKNGK